MAHQQGWLGDAQLSGEESQFNFDMVATHIKFLHDIVDEQVRAREAGGASGASQAAVEKSEVMAHQAGRLTHAAWLSVCLSPCGCRTLAAS